MEKLEKLEAESKRNQVLRSFLDGFNFTFKLQGLKVHIFPWEVVWRQSQPIPLLEVEVGVVALFISILKANVAANVLLKEIKLIEYYRKDQMQDYARQVNNLAGNNMLTQIFDDQFDREQASR
jgi:hypothetical protein